MSSTFYLPRTLTDNKEHYTESELLAKFNHIVVLAEPGGGKTALMDSLAQQLDTSSVTANVFVHMGNDVEKSPLVIDAFDELAKVDQTGINRLLANAKKVNPTHVIISSRSSEWDKAASNAFKDFLGHPPQVVRLCEFDEAEQRTIFDHHLPDEDFVAFRAEVARFDLEPLLPNPQFLKLFADAYIESEKHFADKRSIFSQAVERLAKEANSNITRTNQTLSTLQKVDLSSEVFAKLLLSGAEGVGTSEASEDPVYPLLGSLFNKEAAGDSILATRLFKPGDSADQHRPVHRIVAEYCAADYLTKRVADPSDPLTLAKCLPIIAPNSTVRDELRGLLGWMASLGNKPIEEAAIELDPYAVLANGDPSQLEHSSKRLLIKCLIEVESNDPYFRRGDLWRKFSVAGFFTQDVIKEIKPLLVIGNDGHLRDLLLELLAGSPSIPLLSNELRKLTLAPKVKENTRLLASSCLLEVPDHDHRANLDDLISEASHTSLKVAAEALETLGVETFEPVYLANFLQKCTSLYPSHKERFEHTIGGLYFLKHFIAVTNTQTLEWLLDNLTKDLVCVCNKRSYECDCRNGISKVVGVMLDQYFNLTLPPFDSKRIWSWIGNLHFRGNISLDHNKSVKTLQEDDGLRQGIISHVFENLSNSDHIFEAKEKFGWHSHSGLRFKPDDYMFIVNLAAKNDNPVLWGYFIRRHQYHCSQDERGPDLLRRHMREQALTKPSLMREWIRLNREVARLEREHRVKRFNLSRRLKRRDKQQEHTRLTNIKYIQDNRDLIESGRHLRVLIHFASLVLLEPDKIETTVGDVKLVRNALRNCIDFIAPKVPDLQKLAELQCSSKVYQSEHILYAACLEIMRDSGSLEEVSLPLLRALRTNVDGGYNAISQEERKTLKAEVDRLIFPDTKSAENFLRQYVEPQLAQSGCTHPDISLLDRVGASDQLRGTLSTEWFKSFRELPLSPLDQLFEIVAQYGDHADLNAIIRERCAEFTPNAPDLTENENVEQKRTFWFVRAWYFLDAAPEICWNWITADKDTIFILSELSGQMSHRNRTYWPKLTSLKVEAILEAFTDKWPKVELPSHWGTDSPKEETAYRFLNDIIWTMNSGNPDDAIPVLNRLLAHTKFADYHKNLKSIHASQCRMKALRDFEPPKPQEIVEQLDHDSVVTVEGLRQLIIHELKDFQKVIDGGEFNNTDRFYETNHRLNENQCRDIIADRLNSKLEQQGISVTPEHQLKNEKRCDFTATKMIGGKRRLLVTEVKGQWHKDLYTAASAQLHELYSIHPDAEQQGIYLVIWFGSDEKVAGRKTHDIKNHKALQNKIKADLPLDLKGNIDVFVLDVSRTK